METMANTAVIPRSLAPVPQSCDEESRSTVESTLPRDSTSKQKCPFLLLQDQGPVLFQSLTMPMRFSDRFCHYLKLLDCYT